MAGGVGEWCLERGLRLGKFLFCFPLEKVRSEIEASDPVFGLN